MSPSERELRLVLAGEKLSSMTFPIRDVMAGKETEFSYSLDYIAKSDAALSQECGFPTSLSELRSACDSVRSKAALN